MKLGKWKKVKTEETYQCGGYYSVDKDKIITPGNKEGTYFAIREPRSSIIIVPVDQAENFYLTKQHRYPVNDFSLEFPSGNGNVGESTLGAAKRELKEEMNLVSEKWKKLGTFYVAKGISDLKSVVYLARDVRKVRGKSADPIDQNLHNNQLHSYKKIKLKIKNGQVNAAPTLSAFMLFEINKK